MKQPDLVILAKGDLYPSIGMVLDLARSETALDNGRATVSVGRVNHIAKLADGGSVIDFEDVAIVPIKKWKGGGFEHVEDEARALVDLEAKTIRLLAWRTTNRLQKCTWDNEIEVEIAKEMARLGPLLQNYDFISVVFGCDWTQASGLSQRAWLRNKIDTIKRYNASAIAKKCGVFIVLRAAHIEVQSGQGLIRPMRPHWHLVLSVCRGHRSKSGWERLEGAVAKLRELVGAEVTHRGSFVRDHESLRRMLAYLLRYPVQLVHPTDRDENGLRRKIDLDDPLEGLRLVAFPPAKEQWKRPTKGILPAYSPPSSWDGLTDPLVLLEPFRALSGLVLLARYTIPGTPKKKLSWRAAAKQKRKKARLKVRAKMAATWEVLWPWVKLWLFSFFLGKLLALPQSTDDPNAKNVLIRLHNKTNRKTGKTKVMAVVKHVTTLEELLAANPKLADEMDKN